MELPLLARPKECYSICNIRNIGEQYHIVWTNYGPTWIYWPTGYAIGGTAQLVLLYRCYHRWAPTLLVTTTGRAEQPEDGLRRHHRLCPRDSHESAVGQLEQLADVSGSDPAPSGLDNHATTGSGLMRQSDARD